MFLPVHLAQPPSLPVHCVLLLVPAKVANKATISTYLLVDYVLALPLYLTAFSVTPHLSASTVKVAIT